MGKDSHVSMRLADDSCTLCMDGGSSSASSSTSSLSSLLSGNGALRRIGGVSPHGDSSSCKCQHGVKSSLVIAGQVNKAGSVRFISRLNCRLKSQALVWLCVCLALVNVIAIYAYSSTHMASRLRSRSLWTSYRNGILSGVVQSEPTSPCATVTHQERCRHPAEPVKSFFLSGEEFLRAPMPPVAQYWSSRGIVITASGVVARQAVGTYVTCYIIRKVLKSSLPIEVYHVGRAEAFNETLKEALEDLGDVRVRNLIDALDELVSSYPAGALSSYPYLRPSTKQLASYAAKPYSVLASSFRENLLFDAGAVPFVKPDELFNLTSYQASRFAEFRDYVPSSSYKWDFIPSEWCADIFAMDRYLQQTESDSSCVLYDKAVNWDPLLVTSILNAPLQRFTYRKLNGDKDTWLVGMAHMQRTLRPLESVAGFLFVDWKRGGMANKIHGQVQILKVNAQGKSVEPGEREAARVPLYFNNQLFNFTEWNLHRSYTYMGTFEDFGSLYDPPTSTVPDCAPVPVTKLDSLDSTVVRSFDAVVAALESIGSTHCACRDDWHPTCV